MALAEEGDVVFEGEGAVGGEELYVLALLYGAGEALAVGAAIPRLDAAEGGVGGRPDAQDGRVERDGEHGLAELVEERHPVGLAFFKHEGAAVEDMLRERQAALGEEEALGVGQHAAAFAEEGNGEDVGRRALAAELKIAVEHILGLEMRIVEGRVGANLEIDGLIAGVVNLPDAAQGVVF